MNVKLSFQDFSSRFLVGSYLVSPGFVVLSDGELSRKESFMSIIICR